jgi:phosphoglycolate phosphatase-like HAD superfamily hydrolase
MRPLRALILDFDGVILDSNALKTDAFRRVFARFPEHEAAMLDYHERNVSESRYAKFTHLVENRLGRSGDRAMIDALAEEYASILRDRMDCCPLVHGARDMLDELSGRLPLYLASVTPEKELFRLLDVHALRRHFTRVFGCPPWTKVDAVGTIASDLGGPEGIALIGDSAGDQRAAAAHRVEFIARDSGLPFDPPVVGTAALNTIVGRIRERLAA